MPLWIHGDAPTGVYVGDIRARRVYLGDIELWNGDVPVEIALKSAHGTGSAPAPTLSAGFIATLPSAAAVGSAPAPSVVAGGGAILEPAVGVGSAPAPVLSAAVIIPLSTATGIGTAPAPSIGEVTIPLSPAIGVGSAPAPSVGGGVTIAATTSPAGVGTAPAPSVGAGATVALAPAVGVGTAPAPNAGPPTYVASSTATALASASANLVINYPAGSQSGDLLVMSATFRRAATGTFTIATPSGWTLLQTQDNSSAAANMTATFWRIRGAETSVTVTASTATSTYALGQMHAFRGATKVNAIQVGYDTTAGTAAGTPAVTATAAPVAILLMTTSYNNSANAAYTHTWGGTATERVDTGASWSAGLTYCAMSAATDTQTATGTYPAVACTTSVASNSHYTSAIAIAA